MVPECTPLVSTSPASYIRTHAPKDQPRKNQPHSQRNTPQHHRLPRLKHSYDHSPQTRPVNPQRINTLITPTKLPLPPAIARPLLPSHPYHPKPHLEPHLLPFFPRPAPPTFPPTLRPAATATPLNSPSPFSAPQAAQSVSILTVAQISPLEQGRCTSAADGQKAAKTVLVWPQGWVWA